MESVYIETTIPSYLISRQNNDIIVAGHQIITSEWWDKYRPSFELYTSEIVIQEIQKGDPDYAFQRLNLMKDIPLLKFDTNVIDIIKKYQEYFHFPDKLINDFFHISYAVYYEIDYLLTWNCKHIANAHMKKQLRSYNETIGLFTPNICTPEELIDSNEED